MEEYMGEIASSKSYSGDKSESVDISYGNAHILACLSSAPTNAKIIRTAAQMAKAFHCPFTALFVETPDFPSSPEDKQRLRENQKLAERLGANLEIVYGEDVPYQIAEFARLSGVTTIVLGRSAVARKHLVGKPALTEQLIAYAPEIDIHIIPDKNTKTLYQLKKNKKNRIKNFSENAGKSILILAGATVLSLLFYRLGFTHANIIMVYILGVLLTSIATSRLVYSLVSSIASVFIFNYLFTTPRFTLTAYGTGYPVTFVVMFLTAFITGTFAIRYKEQAGLSAKVAYRTKILFDTNQLLSKAKTQEEIRNTLAQQVIKLTARNLVIFDVRNGKISEPHVFVCEQGMQDTYCLEKERPIVDWVLVNNHSAGATTEMLEETNYLYLTIRINEKIYGVIGIEVGNNPLDAFEHGVLLSILGECALALENERNTREKEEAAILAESEQLRANLLRSISHDLRTPLTTILGNASSLLGNADTFDQDVRHQIYTDIYEDSLWLINLVENLLFSTRIEEGRMTLSISTELLSDIIEEAMNRVNRFSMEHEISIIEEDEMLLVRADAKLVVQVILNLIDNAVKYTPVGSRIVLVSKKIENMVELQVIDNGFGIPDEEKIRIFDKFYCGDNRIADNRRSIGLGLYLCKSIIEAHGGFIYVKDHKPHGSIFGITLPLEEVKLYE